MTSVKLSPVFSGEGRGEKNKKEAEIDAKMILTDRRGRKEKVYVRDTRESVKELCLISFFLQVWLYLSTRDIS